MKLHLAQTSSHVIDNLPIATQHGVDTDTIDDRPYPHRSPCNLFRSVAIDMTVNGALERRRTHERRHLNLCVTQAKVAL